MSPQPLLPRWRPCADGGSGWRLTTWVLTSDSIRQIRKIRPDFIKLDRTLIAGIETDTLRQAFGEVMTEFAAQVGAVLIAEGVETREELAMVTSLGVTAGQGYYLGRPTVRPRDWAGGTSRPGYFGRWQRLTLQICPDSKPGRRVAGIDLQQQIWPVAS